jgi:hypothetical protein
MTSISTLQLAGDPLSIGRMYGEALRGKIQDFLDDDLCRLNRLLHKPTSLEALRDTINLHGEMIAREMPDIFSEIRGLAEGAKIGLDAALLLQLRREVMGYSRLPTGGDCTTLCRPLTPDAPVLAQTIDLNGDIDDQMVVIRIAHCLTGRHVLVLSFTGLLGYLGLNGSGLAIGINLVLGGPWQPGVPPYLAIRHLLDHCVDVESCLNCLGKLPLASSRSLTICDRRHAVTVEMLHGRMAVIRDKHLVHTNHFLSDEFAAEDALNPFSRNSSVLRLKACRDMLCRLPEQAGAEDIMNVFCHEPIRVKANGDCRRERTVGAVVMFPSDGCMHVRCGDPALTTTQAFRLYT